MIDAGNSDDVIDVIDGVFNGSKWVGVWALISELVARQFAFILCHLVRRL